MPEYAWVCSVCGTFCHDEGGKVILARDGLASKMISLPRKDCVCEDCQAKPPPELNLNNRELPPGDR